MTRILLPAAALAGLLSTSSASTIVAPGDAGAIPGVSTFSYDSYFVLGGDHTAAWTSDTDAYSWDHPMLASSNPALGNQTGWTHLTRWVAFTLTEPADLTISIASAGGIQIPDQNNPGAFVGAGDDLIPAFTLWSGFEVLAENASLGLADPQGGHRWDNDGNETAWMDQLLYQAHDGNLGGNGSISMTLSLDAGDYTMNVAGNRGGVFDPGVVAGDLRKGFTASLVTVPEPTSVLLLALGFGLPVLRRRR